MFTERKSEDEALGTIMEGKVLPGTSSSFSVLGEVSPFLQFLASTPVETVHPRDVTDMLSKNCFKGNNVCILMEDEHVPKAFKKLIACNFLSAPVLFRDTYVGMVEMKDFVHLLVELLEQGHEGEESSFSEWVTTENWWKDLETKEQWQLATVRDVMACSDKPTVPIPFGFSLLFAMEVMARLKMHHVPVLGNEGNVASILTCSMVISLIRQHKDLPEVAELLKLTVGNLMANTTFTTSECINEKTPAIRAFARMVSMKLSALAIVNSHGILTGVISKSDLKVLGYGAERLKLLGMPVLQFKARAVAEAIKRGEQGPSLIRDPVDASAPHSKPKPQPPLNYVTRYETLGRCVELMEDGRVHQLIICSEDTAHAGKPVPIGIMDQPDVLWAVLRQLGFRATVAFPDER